MPFVIGITGHKGLLGSKFLEHDGAVPIEADVTKLAAVQHRVAEIEPDAIVHCAAWTDVDGCERAPMKAHKVNVDGTYNVIRASQGVPVALISTDYVFDGKVGPYQEEDIRSPLNVYGMTKLLAEDLMRPQDLICRTTVLYGQHPSKIDFVFWIRYELESGGCPSTPYDQWGTPTYAHNLAAMIRALVRAQYSGIWHTAGAAYMNRYRLARLVARVFGYDEHLIRPVTTAELGQSAQRPRRGGLLTAKFQEAFPSIPCMTPYEGLMEIRRNEDRL